MLREGTGYCRPVERLAEASGMQVEPLPGLREGCYYILHDRVVIFYPDWMCGARMREAEIARQILLASLAGLGRDVARERVSGTVGKLTAPYAEELAS